MPLSAAALDAEVAALGTMASGLGSQASALGGVVTEARRQIEAMADTWGGPRATSVIGVGTTYVDAVKPAVDALESAKATLDRWQSTGEDLAATLHSAEQRLASLDAEIARGLEYPGQIEDRRAAVSRLAETRAQWQSDCASYAGELSEAMSALAAAGLVAVPVDEPIVLYDETYFPAVAELAVVSGLDLSVVDPTGQAEAAVTGRAALLGSEDGAAMFLVFDAANQGDLDKADGNLSEDDIIAATDPARVEALLRQAAEREGFEWDPEQLATMVAEITGTAWMMRSSRDEVWEDIDDDREWYEGVVGFVQEHVFAPVMAFGVGALCYGAAAGGATVTGGASLAAAAYCGGLASATYRAADNWANGEGLEGVVEGLTDPGAWGTGMATGFVFQGATNFLLRAPRPSPALATAAGSVDEAYHYTFRQYVSSIAREGLTIRYPGARIFTTPNGSLSPLQAQIELALPPNRGLPNAVIQIDVAGMRAAGYEIPAVHRITSTVASGSRVYSQPGGGYEMVFDYSIPPEFLKVVVGG
jgi:hypothetical protein